MINLTAFALSLTLIIILTKLSSFLVPFNLYFSFSTLFVGSGELFSGKALAIKLAIPTIVGMVVYYVPYKVAISMGTRSDFGKRLDTFCTEHAVPSVQAAAFFGAVLLAWPMIVHWDVLAGYAVRQYRGTFIIIYFLYFFSFGLLAGAGARMVGTLIARRQGQRKPKWISTLRDGFIGALAGGIASTMINLVVKQ